MTIQSLENYLRETAKIKPDVVVLPDFPVEHSLQSKVHYVTRIYTLRDKAKEVEDHVLSMQSDGEIRDPFDLTRLPPEAGFDGIVNTQAKNIERDKQLRDRLLYDANFNKGVVMCYGEDAHVIQSLLEKGHSVAYTHLDMENPLGRISTNFIDDYNEIGALVMKLGEGPKDNTKTVFVSSSDYDKLLSYDCDF